MTAAHLLLPAFLFSSYFTYSQKFINTFQKGDYEKTIKLCEKAIDKDSKNKDAYLIKALSNSRLAVDDATAAKHVSGIEKSLGTLSFLIRKDSAYTNKHAAETNEIKTNAFNYTKKLIEQKNIRRAESIIKQLIDIDPLPEYHYVYGKIFAARNDERELAEYNIAAKTIYLGVINKKIEKPYLPETFADLANLFYKKDDISSAAVIYNRALRIFNDSLIVNAYSQMLAGGATQVSGDFGYTALLSNADTLISYNPGIDSLTGIYWNIAQAWTLNSFTTKTFDEWKTDVLPYIGKYYRYYYPQILSLYANQIILHTTVSEDAESIFINADKLYFNECMQLIQYAESTGDDTSKYLSLVENYILLDSLEGAAKLLYNIKMLSPANKNIEALQQKIIALAKKEDENSAVRNLVDTIYDLFPDDTYFKTYQYTEIIKKINAAISQKKFTEAANSIRTQIKLTPNDEQLNQLFKKWIIEDFKANYLGSEISSDELNWTGSAEKCEAGTISNVAQKKFLQRLNYLRRLAGVPDQSILNEEWNKKCQQAALIMYASGNLSHFPDNTWKCFTQDGKTAAGNSNLGLGNNSVYSLMDQMNDDGAGNTAVGHRRWILYPYRKVYGHGSTTESMVLWALGGNNADYPDNVTAKFENQYVAWPPPGYVPAPLIGWRWSFSLQNADFSDTKVTVSTGGKNISCKVLPPQNGYGLPTIVFDLPDLPNSVKNETTYTVTVKNVKFYGNKNEKKFTYTVTYIPVEE